jgi:hypothetical protein
MFMPPTPPPPQAAPPKLEANGASISATRNYFQMVNQILDELKRKIKNLDDYNKSAAWHDSFAKSIEQLSTRYVDPDMVKYAQTQVAKLKTLSHSLRGTVVEVSALQGGTVYIANYSGGFGWWGGGGNSVSVESNVAKIRTQQADIVAKDATRRFDIWESTNTDRDDILKLMQQRYKVDMAR